MNCPEASPLRLTLTPLNFESGRQLGKAEPKLPADPLQEEAQDQENGDHSAAQSKGLQCQS